MTMGVSSNLPVVARCKKCGREFLTLPERRPWTDPYLPQGIRAKEWMTAQVCGGEIVRLDGEKAGTAKLDAGETK